MSAQEPGIGTGGSATDDPAAPLNLKQVAQILDVHYMTAYRYVRSGRLGARREGTAWVVDRVDLDRFRNEHLAAAGTSPEAVDWIERLRGRLAVGDQTGAWSTVQAALVAGWEPEQVLVDLISEAVRRTDDDANPAASHLAVTTATRTVALVAARFRRRGRSRGTVVLGSPIGEGHTLGLAVVADVLRLRNFDVLDLGSSVPPEAFASAAEMADRLVAVALGVTRVECLDAVAVVADAIRSVSGEVPVLVGGRAVASPELAELTGGTAWAADAASMAALVESFLPTPRTHRSKAPTGDGSGTAAASRPVG